MNIDELKKLLRNYNLKPNFTYGQNFLIDNIALQDIVDAAEITSADAVLEIGPGIGNLTRILCERAGFVLSIEKDDKFFPVLHSIKKDYKNDFRFEIADALEYNFQDFFVQLQSSPPFKGGVPPKNTTPSAGAATPPLQEGNAPRYKVVANIPYYITGKILQMLMTAKFKPLSITILTQKEVAQNIIAKPGKLSVLAISVQLYGEPKIMQIVPAKSFYPAPKVDSAVLQIVPHKKNLWGVFDEKKLFKVLKACFSGKRKQLHNTLTNNLRLEKNRTLEILYELQIKASARPQELSIEQWIKLIEKIVVIPACNAMRSIAGS